MSTCRGIAGEAEGCYLGGTDVDVAGPVGPGGVGRRRPNWDQKFGNGSVFERRKEESTA